MQRELLNEICHYFSSIQNKCKEEVRLLKMAEGYLNYFPITYVHRDDLKSKGFDVSEVSDADMIKLADKLSNDYLGQLFWESLQIIAEDAL